MLWSIQVRMEDGGWGRGSILPWTAYQEKSSWNQKTSRRGSTKVKPPSQARTSCRVPQKPRRWQKGRAILRHYCVLFTWISQAASHFIPQFSGEDIVIVPVLYTSKQKTQWQNNLSKVYDWYIIVLGFKSKSMQLSMPTTALALPLPIPTSPPPFRGSTPDHQELVCIYVFIHQTMTSLFTPQLKLPLPARQCSRWPDYGLCGSDESQN